MNARTRFAAIAAAAAITVGFAGNAHAGLLVPAIQKVREAAARSNAPAEEIAFNFEKIAVALGDEELLLLIESGEVPPEALMGNLDRDIIRRIPSRPRPSGDE